MYAAVGPVRGLPLLVVAGIGSIPDAVLSGLFQHKDLGIHSEMFSDRAVELVNNGNITNARKKIQTGRIVSSFVIGTKKCFDFLDDNPFIGESFQLLLHVLLHFAVFDLAKGRTI